MLIRPLAELKGTDAPFAGGKGANLGELVAAGLPVPDAFVIGAAASRLALEHPDGRLPPDLEREILTAFAGLGEDVSVAVRSSGIAEDGEEASYAGINETVQNVRGDEALLAALRRCWESARAAGAERYRAARGDLPDEAGVAIVVQRQVASALAGVAFTVDPVTGDDTHLVIEAVRGQGEAVVSGVVTPDRIVIDKSTLDTTSYTVGGQTFVLEAAGDLPGLTMRELPQEEVGTPALTRNQMRRLGMLAKQIEAHYGRPQDIEWAFDERGSPWILQARPITTLDGAAALADACRLYDHPRPRGSRWTRANIGEALPGVPTPLTWSLWSNGIEAAHWAAQIELGVARERERHSAPVALLCGGWPAISVDLVESQLSRLPGLDPDAFAEQFFGGTSAGRVQAPPAGRALTAARVATRAPFVLTRLGARLHAAAQASRVRWAHDAWTVPADPVALLGQAAARFTATMTAHTLQTYLCQGLYQAVDRIAGDRTSLLVSGDGKLSEARLATDLWRVAGGGLTEAEFLREHGYHGPCEGELAAASWREQPEPVRRTARHWAEADATRDPALAAERRRQQRLVAEAELVGSMPAWKRAGVVRLLRLARGAVVARELGKAAFLQDLDVARHAARAIGDDAVWATIDEITAGALPSPATTTARRTVRDRHASAEPPVHLVGHDVATAPDPRPGGSSVSGIGASPGVVRGRARVVTDPGDAGPGLRQDEILIARTTDPSWVTTFLTAGGMVIDVGGALSHAAIIARELGVPCVIGTGNGTTAIAEGALIEIDGMHGTVRILERAEASGVSA